jgi:hypothetical protein
MTTPAHDRPARDASDAAGDSGDQALDLRTASEQEAIAAALAGHPRGDDIVDRPARTDILEGDDPLDDLLDGDASDDPLHGGDDLTGVEPFPRVTARDEDDRRLDDEDAEALDQE